MAEFNLDSAANEVLLFHGTDAEIVDKIIAEGLDSRLSSGIFGHGTYCASNASKSDEYAKPNTDGEFKMLLGRVTLGIPWIRTLSFITGFGCQLALAWQILM